MDTLTFRWELGTGGRQGTTAGGTMPLQSKTSLNPVAGADLLLPNSTNQRGILMPPPFLSSGGGDSGKTKSKSAGNRLTPLGLPHPVPLRPSSGRPNSDGEKSTPSSGSSHSQEAVQQESKDLPPNTALQRSPPQLPPMPPVSTSATVGAPLLPSICRGNVDPGVAEFESERHWADVQQDDPCPTFLAAISHMSPPPTQQGSLFLQLYSRAPRNSTSSADGAVSVPTSSNPVTETRPLPGGQPSYILCDCALNGEELLVVPRPQQLQLQKSCQGGTSTSTANFSSSRTSAVGKENGHSSGPVAAACDQQPVQLPYPFRVPLTSIQGAAATELADYRECRQHWAFCVGSFTKPQSDMGLADSISGEFLQISSLPWSRNVVPWAPKPKKLQPHSDDAPSASPPSQQRSAADHSNSIEEGTLSQFPYVMHFRAPNYSDLVDWVEALRGATCPMYV